jgi:hypothetical protein
MKQLIVMDQLWHLVRTSGIRLSVMDKVNSVTRICKLELWESDIVFNNKFWSATNICLRYASAKCGR